jgi:hypothetical protein
MQVLSDSTWRRLAAEHVATVGPWLKAFRERRKRRLPHPVHDFLFVYYRYSPKKLQQWHPGIGFALEVVSKRGMEVDSVDAMLGPEFSDETYSSLPTNNHNPTIKERSGCSTIFCDTRKITRSQRERMQWSRDMLARTAARSGNFGCFGLHEWAMVFEGAHVRHKQTAPLRLPQVEIDQVVRQLPIACSHFDAFRFFAENARSLNVLQPTVDDRADFEQPACIHANMDLYKWAFKAMPWIGSDLLLDCFLLARDAREIDMRASPYDLAEYGIEDPIRIETDSGRNEYQLQQRELADRAKPLRQRLIDRLDSILSRSDCGNLEEASPQR